MVWIKRIQQLWTRLEEDHDNQELTRLEDQIKNNKRILKLSEDENTRETIKLCKLDVKLIAQQKSMSKHTVIGDK